MPLRISDEAMITFETLRNTPRVPMPDGIPDDAHNRIDGLVQMVVENFPVNAVIMELGSGMGVSTEVFALLCKEVHTTDTWGPGLEKWREAFDLVFKRHSNIVQYYRKSGNCVHLFQDNFFDAVYIDTDHRYEDVLCETMTWLPKVKTGGFICGHDYIARPQYSFAVIEAVNEIFGKPDKVYEDMSWIVKK